VVGSAELGQRRQPATVIRIRPIEPGDHERLQAFYAALSNESRRTRFFAPTAGIGARQSAFFCTPDHHHREGFVAVIDPGDRTDRIVGHICVEPDGSDAAEVAVTVADELQHRGIGRMLVDAAARWARREGLRRLTATMLADNPAIHRLLGHLGLPSKETPIGAGVVEIRISLEAMRSAA
jgi:RimJ/RimL family protein N-acetyltransferase